MMKDQDNERLTRFLRICLKCILLWVFVYLIMHFEIDVFIIESLLSCQFVFVHDLCFCCKRVFYDSLKCCWYFCLNACFIDIRICLWNYCCLYLKLRTSRILQIIHVFIITYLFIPIYFSFKTFFKSLRILDNLQMLQYFHVNYIFI